MANQEKQSISVREVGRRLGCGDELVHAGIISGKLPFGVAIRMPSGRYRYMIPRAAFEKWCENPKAFTETGGVK
jgi:hypothetical protein